MSKPIRFFYQLKKLRNAWPCVGCEHFTSRGTRIQIRGCPWMVDQVIPHVSVASSWEYLDRDVLEIVLQCTYVDEERAAHIRELWLEEKPHHYKTVVVEPERHGMPCRDIGNGWVELV